MPCYGLYTDERVAVRKAAGSSGEGGERFVVDAVINGFDGFAVVDEADRDTLYIYDAKAEPGHRLTAQREPTDA